MERMSPTHGSGQPQRLAIGTTSAKADATRLRGSAGQRVEATSSGSNPLAHEVAEFLNYVRVEKGLGRSLARGLDLDGRWLGSLFHSSLVGRLRRMTNR